jgi:hypothetical protein
MSGRGARGVETRTMTADPSHIAATPAMNPDLLTAEDRRDLQVFEERVLRYHDHGYLMVGEDLLTIQERRLYRETHPTFEKYLKARFQMARATAYRLIGAVQVKQDLDLVASEAGVSNLETPREGTIRPLVKVPHDKRQVVLEALVKRVGQDGERLTASLVNRTVQEFLPQYAGSRRTKTLDKARRQLTDGRLEELAHELAHIVSTKCPADRALVLRRAAVLADRTDRDWTRT